jgi:D-alanyl-D-alanine carboxypeptidase
VDKDLYLTIPRGRMKDLKASYVLNSTELHAPLQKNQVVGTINFQLDGKTSISARCCCRKFLKAISSAKSLITLN